MQTLRHRATVVVVGGAGGARNTQHVAISLALYVGTFQYCVRTQRRSLARPKVFRPSSFTRYAIILSQSYRRYYCYYLSPVPRRAVLLYFLRRRRRENDTTNRYRNRSPVYTPFRTRAASCCRTRCLTTATAVCRVTTVGHRTNLDYARFNCGRYNVLPLRPAGPCTSCRRLVTENSCLFRFPSVKELRLCAQDSKNVISELASWVVPYGLACVNPHVHTVMRNRRKRPGGKRRRKRRSQSSDGIIIILCIL